MIKLVVLDFDDTLCLTEGITFKIENEILTRMGLPPMRHEIHTRTWGKPVFEAISLRSPGIDVELFKRVFQEVLLEHIARGEFDNVSESNLQALDMLLAQGKKQPFSLPGDWLKLSIS